jgi:tripartite-type tricarboxylate transporter receptor subunit TctC
MNPKQMSRRACLTAGAAASLALACPQLAFAQSAQAYPSRSVRLAVGFAPGTGPDVLTRVLGQRLGETIGQPMVIENRAGAGGQIAAQFVAKSPADGYTLLIGDVSAISIAPAAFEQPRVDQRNGHVGRELTQNRDVPLGELAAMTAEDVERAERPGLVHERHDDR